MDESTALTPRQRDILDAIANGAPDGSPLEVVIDLDGPLDPDGLRRSVEQAAATFDALRTALLPVPGFRTPRQVVGAKPPVAWTETDGEAVMPLLNGYVTASNDSGHSNATNSDPNNAGGSSFGVDPQARIDFGYNAITQVKGVTNALISRYYGKVQDHSYFMGCSGGGRQGMMFTQRFPTYFDGVIAHAPAMRVSSGATIAAMWNNIALTSVAPVVNGAPILSQALSQSDLALVSGKILQQCDSLDGALDIAKDLGKANPGGSYEIRPIALFNPGAVAT